MTDHQPRPSLFPGRLGPVQLVTDEAVLAGAAAACRAAGWTVHEVDAADWADRDRLHDELAAALRFPPYYGRNLDALDDALGGLAEGRYGLDPGSGGMAIVVRTIDRLLAADERLGRLLIELLVRAAGSALAHGLPIAVLLHSEDPALDLAPVPVPIDRHPGERRPHRQD